MRVTPSGGRVASRRAGSRSPIVLATSSTWRHSSARRAKRSTGCRVAVKREAS